MIKLHAYKLTIRVEEGKLYAWGAGASGQLGYSEMESVKYGEQEVDVSTKPK